jgi:hypothetical protein
MASIRTPSEATWFWDWYEPAGGGNRPIGDVAGRDVTLPDGVIEHRILLIAQPGSAVFMVKPLPPLQA